MAVARPIINSRASSAPTHEKAGTPALETIKSIGTEKAASIETASLIMFVLLRLTWMIIQSLFPPFQATEAQVRDHLQHQTQDP
jgi:hypothetical protein